MAKLDIELRSLLISKALYEQHPDEQAYFIDPVMQLFVSVEFNGDIQPLIDAGFVARDISNNVAYGTITVEVLKKLNELPSVIAIEQQRQKYTQLDKSIPEIHANDIWSRTGDNFHGYTGRGVIVGIIDTGIDFRHPNFISPNGQSRIIRIWDQTMNAPLNSPVGSEAPPSAITEGPFQATLGYGVQYFRDDITKTINDTNPSRRVRHKDEDGHGTHVAGIAAGNGKQAGGCHGEYNYIGVAPEAEFVIVRRWGLTDGDQGEKLKPPSNPPLSPPSASLDLDAFKYIFEIGRKLSMPVVINCSFGAFSRFMNGSSRFCRDVDTLLTNNSQGRMIVWGAGNDGEEGFHATGTVPASGSIDLEFKIARSDSETHTIAVLYTGSNLEVQLISPVGGANGTVSWVTPNSSGFSTTANGSGGRVTLDNQPNEIGIAITPPPPTGTPPVSRYNVANTETQNWKIQLRNTTNNPTTFNAFCEGGSQNLPKSARFLDHISTIMTLKEEASGRETISVGSYKVGGQLAKSSARGPTLDARTKPDLCAPGVGIWSAAIAKEREGDLVNCCCECCQDWYKTESGTSMAAPHVTGVIALMLHKNPNLPHTQIKTLLATGADGRPGDAPPPDVVGWGAGKLSAMNSVNPTPVVNPPVPVVASPTVESPDDLPQGLREQFLGTSFGQIYYDLAEKYFHEILGLINTNKRVATAWHRSRGPVWTRIAMTAFYNHDFKIPLSADGVPITESVDRFVEMLKRYASPELNSDVERFKPYIHLLKEEMTLPELAALLGNQPLPVQEYTYFDS
jgi:subtilisin family serine protease